MSPTARLRRRGWGRRPLGRLLAAAALATFLATGPGTAGLEVGYHLLSSGSSDHAHQVHVEPAGATAHSDHCQLGATFSGGRLPAPEPSRFHTEIGAGESGFRPLSAPRTRRITAGLHSRAPPALG